MIAPERREEHERAELCIVAPLPGMRHLLTGGGRSSTGGIQTQWAALLRCLRGRGWPLTVITESDGSSGASVSMDGMRILSAAPHAGSVRRLARALEAWRLLKAADSDIYLMQGAGPWAAVAAAFSRAHNRRFIFWLASDTDAMCRASAGSRLRRAWRVLAWWGIKRADAVIVQTRRQQQLVRHYLGQNATVVPNVCVSGARDATDSPCGPVLWVSNIRWEKRPLRALQLAEALPQVGLTMIGGPVRGQEGLYDEVKRQAACLPNVSFLGPLPFSQADGYFASASLLLNTSAVEGFPNTFLQAWWWGLPVVSTFDPDEVICRHGFGVHAQSLEGLVAAVGGLLSKAHVRQAMGRAAQAHVRSVHGQEHVLRLLEGVIRQVKSNREADCPWRSEGVAA